MTVVSTSPPRHTLQEVHSLLEATRGAWGPSKTLEEIDAEIDRLRAEWDRGPLRYLSYDATLEGH